MAAEKWAELLGETAELFRITVENLPINLVLYDRDYRILYMNPTLVTICARLCGKAPDELPGMRGAELWPAPIWGPLYEHTERAIATGERQSYDLAANMPITRVSELMVLPGFGVERFRKLQPFISALPVDAKLNVCTAPGEVIDSLSTERNFGEMDPEVLATRRKDACFPTLEDVKSSMPAADYNLVKDNLADKSSYVRATVWVTIGTTQFTLYSLLARGGTGPVRPVLRSFGAE